MNNSFPKPCCLLASKVRVTDRYLCTCSFIVDQFDPRRKCGQEKSQSLTQTNEVKLTFLVAISQSFDEQATLTSNTQQHHSEGQELKSSKETRQGVMLRS